MIHKICNLAKLELFTMHFWVVVSQGTSVWLLLNITSWFVSWKIRNPTLVPWKQTNSFYKVYIICLANPILSFFQKLAFLFCFIFFSFLMVIKFPRRICYKAVTSNYQTIKCNKCNLWIDIKCNKINKTYIYLKSDSSHWYCISCTKVCLPFSDFDRREFVHTSIGKHLKFIYVFNTPN